MDAVKGIADDQTPLVRALIRSERCVAGDRLTDRTVVISCEGQSYDPRGH
jgi:hypothetical protein